MGELITITKEDSRPRIICGQCQEEILIDIEPFRKDCTKILRDKCPKCKTELFVGILILAHPQLQGLTFIIKTIIEGLTSKHKIIGGKAVKE